MDFVTVSTGLILPYWMGLPIRYIQFINVPMISYFQKNIEINQQTQFFSIMTLSSNIMVPLGTFIAGILCDLMGADVVYLTSGIIMLVYVYIMRWNIKNEEI